MTSEITKQIENAVKPLLKEAGFKKNGLTWRLSTDQGTAVFNIQRSSWSTAYYFNFGFHIGSLEKKTLPKESDCHVRGRIENLLGSEEEMRESYRYLDFENEIEMPSRLEKLAWYVDKRIIPWLVRHSETQELLGLLRGGRGNLLFLKGSPEGLLEAMNEAEPNK